jgi:hypothetical protein
LPQTHLAGGAEQVWPDLALFERRDEDSIRPASEEARQVGRPSDAQRSLDRHLLMRLHPVFGGLNGFGLGNGHPTKGTHYGSSTDREISEFAELTAMLVQLHWLHGSPAASTRSRSLDPYRRDWSDLREVRICDDRGRSRRDYLLGVWQTFRRWRSVFDEDRPSHYLAAITGRLEALAHGRDTPAMVAPPNLRASYQAGYEGIGRAHNRSSSCH